MHDLGAMRGFLRVVEAGSFTRAAALLEMPRSSLTKAVQGLEAQLGVKLLNRTTRRVVVTPDGAAYYARLVRLMEELDDLNGSLSSAQARPAGRLRVELGGSIAQQVLIPALPEFQARFPDISLELSISDRTADLIGENVDCAIRAGHMGDLALVARRIVELDIVTCAAPAYVAGHGLPTSPAVLQAEHVAVSYMNALSGQIFPFNFIVSGRVTEVRCRHRLAVSEGMAYVAAAIAGLGIIQVPRFMVRDALGSGQLVTVLEQWPVEPRGLYVVYAPNRHVSARLRAFIDWVIELFEANDCSPP